jgi:TolA-binding protein
MKHLSAILTALVITAVIGLGIFVIGVNALTNTNTVAIQNSPNGSLTASDPANTSVNNNGASATTSSNVQQLQQQVNSLQSQLNQSNQALQQYQSLISVLQQRGIIFIDQNGNIYLPEGGGSSTH